MKAKTTTPKPTNDHKHWGDDDTKLAQMIGWHTAIELIAQTLGRSVRGVKERIREHHADTWAKSGHPESAQVALPHAVGGMTRNSQERHHDLAARLERIEAKLDQLLAALGEDKPEQRANGRAHAP